MGPFIGGHNLSHIRYKDETVLTADAERKRQEISQRVLTEFLKKGLNMNYMKIKCMVVSKGTDQHAHYKLKIQKTS